MVCCGLFRKFGRKCCNVIQKSSWISLGEIQMNALCKPVSCKIISDFWALWMILSNALSIQGYSLLHCDSVRESKSRF